MTGGQQAIENGLQGFPVLECFAIGQNNRQNVVTGQGLRQALQVQRCHCRIGDDSNLTPDDMRGQELGLIQQAFANMDRVATLTKLDLKCLHVSPH